MTNPIPLDQWARSLFTTISEPAESDSRKHIVAHYEPGNGRAGETPVVAPRQAGEDTSDPASPAPDFRYRPVVTGGKSIPHGGYVK